VDIRRKIFLIMVLFVVCFVFILYRIVYIDFCAPYRARLAYAKTDWMTFERGSILDRNGSPLALSIRQTSVAINPSRVLKTKLGSYIGLCNILGMEFRQFKALLEKNTQFIWLKRQVDDATVERIKKLDLDGVQFVAEYRRFYPNQDLASHVLGFVGIDNVGLEGTELYFDSELKGSPDDEAYQKEGSRKNTGAKTVAGKNVILTIDKFVQNAVEKELKKVYKEYKPESVSAIVMDPRNGDILAMANLPDFDPNNVRLYSQKSMKNLCVASYYEPGSVFKIIAGTALMMQKEFPFNETFTCPGSIHVGNKTIKCWKAHGTIAYKDVFRYSCNVGMIKMALKLEVKDFYNVIRSFGFGSMTGVELPGEVRGLLRQPHQWTLFSKGSLAIGQEIAVTPLQLVTACAAVANGGLLYQPHIVKAIKYADGTSFRMSESLVIRRIAASNLTARLTDLLIRVTEKGGTGDRAALPRYDIAGKTGTAQIYDNKGNSYMKDKFILSFLGFYPAHNPELIMLIIIKKPAGRPDLTGGIVAAPVFHDIAVGVNSYLNIIPIDNVVNASQYRGRGKSDESGQTYALDSLPDFTGYNMKQVAVILKNLGLQPNFIGTGTAYRQVPEPRTRIDKSVPVTVWFKEAGPASAPE